MAEIISVDDIIRKMRAGYSADLKIKYGEYEIPCRLMSATEERRVIGQARANLVVIHEGSKELDESLAVMKAVLLAGCTVDNTPRLPQGALDKLTNAEVESLFDQYTTICKTVNPGFESLTEAQIVELIQLIKKKGQKANDLFTWQRAEIGRYFLDVFLPAANAPGS